MLYELFFQPIVTIFKYLYLALFSMTGKLGLSLILMSIVVNILLRPFSAWASKIQEKERRIQEILAPQIAEIKRKYHGAEQHSELSELYKRYAYNPLYAIRSGMDLFIQLLPLSAAYVMLSSLTILQGQSFAGISDLSRPDGLIFGINLLPIAMTVINFLTTLTAERFTRRERIQAFVIAILFFILLYNAPSALLVYWTSNNFIMLLKNLYAKTFGRAHEKISLVLSRQVSPENKLLKFVMFFVPCVLWSVYSCCFYKLYLNFAPDMIMEMNKNSMMITLMFIFIFAWMLFLNFTKYNFTLSEIIVRLSYILVGALLLIIISNIFTVRGNNYDLRLYARYRITFLLSVQLIYLLGAAFLSVPYEKAKKITDTLTGGNRNSLFFAVLVFMIFLFCLFYPALLYSSDQGFFPSSLLSTVISILKYGIGFLIASILLWTIFPIPVQNILAVLAAFGGCVAFINFFILTEDYGQLQTLQLNDNTLQIGMRGLLKDLTGITLSLIIIIICIKKRWIKFLINGFYILSFAMFAVFGYYYFTTPENKIINTALSEKVKLPEYHDRLWRFSKTKQNVVGFFFDAFTGDHLLRILEDDPTLREKLDGFIYFPDTVAPGACTALSTASIYGGAAYKPNTLNKAQPDKLITEKYADAFAFYPNVFSEKNYDTVIAGMSVLRKDQSKYLENKIKNLDSALLIYDAVWGYDYVPYWLQWATQRGFSLQNQDQQEYISRFSIFMALLRASPFTIRYRLYRAALSLKIMESVLSIGLKNWFLPNIAAIQFMGDFAHVDDDAPAFKMIYSCLSHVPWFMPSDDLFPVVDPYPDTNGQTVLVNGVFPEHYYTEKHIIYFLADFIASLKKLGIYDNTRIVVVSDHDFADSWKLQQNYTTFYDNTMIGTARPNSLLMFKDFNSHSPLKISDAFMSIEDTPSLLMDGIARADGIPTLNEIRKMSNPQQEAIRVRTHCRMPLRGEGETATQFNLDQGTFEIIGTVFNKENWKKIE